MYHVYATVAAAVAPYPTAAGAGPMLPGSPHPRLRIRTAWRSRAPWSISPQSRVREDRREWSERVRPREGAGAGAAPVAESKEPATP